MSYNLTVVMQGSHPNEEGNGITVTAIHYEQDGKSGMIQLHNGDLCIMTNGCMTDNATLGDLNTPANMVSENPLSGNLWAIH